LNVLRSEQVFLKMQNDWCVGIIGSGKMGTNIVEYLIGFNLQIIWFTRTEQRREEKKTRITKKISRMVRNGELTVESGELKKKDIEITSDSGALRRADFIIECISEDLNEKRKLFSMICSSISESAIILSNTSSLPLQKIFERVRGIQRCAGLHFIYPVQLKNMVEVNLLKQNTVPVVGKIANFVKFIERKAIFLTEQNHFALNRLFFLYFAQAFRVVQAGVLSIEEVDSLIERDLFAIGPFRFIDSVGIDIILESVRHYIKIPAEQKFCDPWLLLMDDLIKNDCLGTCPDKGFYGSPLIDKFVIKVDDGYEEKEKKKVQTLLLLKSVFLNSFFTELSKGYTNTDVLFEAVDEYMGCKQMMEYALGRNEIQTVVNELLSEYSATLEEVYKPVPMLIEWAYRPVEKTGLSGDLQ
jgi:3-hydroxybutyryl-CoA dehydrogenase